MAQVTFAADTTPSLVDLDANFTELYNKTAWSTTGIGYATGAGGTITQATNKATDVTLNKKTGRITTANAALAAGASVSFGLINSTIGADDVVHVCMGTGMASSASYRAHVGSSSAGQCSITLTNISGGSLSEVVTIKFIVFSGVVA